MNQLRIAHLSDPHFGTILPGVREGLLATLAELKPDLVLLTGDITQRARRSQFREAKEFTRAMSPTPIIAVPGNHDIPLLNIFGRVLNPYYGFKKLFKDQLEKDFVHGDVLITGLNSTNRWRHVQGDFDLRRLRRRLTEKKPKALVHIAAFHHPMDCAKPQDEKNLLKARDATIQLFDQHGVDLMIGGHIHDPYVSLSKVRYPNTRRTMVIGVAGTCMSWRIRKGAPNSFNFIEVDTREVPTLKISRFDQRVSLRYTVEREHHFKRPDESGWMPI
jgi:3',5'-cyclic AMP phosphodiesterase CpdA